MRHPEVYERLRAEVADGQRGLPRRGHQGDAARAPAAADRAAPVNKPFQLGEYELEPGTLVAACICLVHHSEDLYPEPDRFRPERFLEQPAGKYTWIPFGGGTAPASAGISR